jgi:Glycosyl hydrolases family 16
MVGYTFQDEFDGPAGSPPDPARWGYDLGGGGWGNDELQVYTDARANVFQDGRSHLVIRATRELAPGPGAALPGRGTAPPGPGTAPPDRGTAPPRPGTAPPGPTYRSARITTRGKFAQLGGSFEARIKVSSQRGLWPACWLMGQDIGTAGWPRCGEVDLLEDFGYSAVQSSVHVPVGGDAVHTAHADLPGDDRWHVYRLDWAPGGMSFSRDGQRYLTVRHDFCPPGSWVYGPQPPHNGGMFLLLNLAVGGNVGAPPGDTRFPADLMVDYVRVSPPDGWPPGDPGPHPPGR